MAPVELCRSEPARSTRLKAAQRERVTPPAASASRDSSTTVKTAWEREDSLGRERGGGTDQSR